MEIKRGDILIVNFEPVQGSEQGNIRPAVVIQNNEGNIYSPLTIVAPITSKKFLKNYPTNVFISRNDSGLDKDSTILLNQIRTIDKSRILHKVSILNNFVMNEVDMAIKVSLELE
ncbi:MAG: type II toxin-antitoxin system PemK/MazF family toxin [Nanoarchaeota archaeon]